MKDGLTRGKQRYRCKGRGLSFADTPPRGMPPALEATAVPPHPSGPSMGRAAKLLGVATPSVGAGLDGSGGPLKPTRPSPSRRRGGRR